MDFTLNELITLIEGKKIRELRELFEQYPIIDLAEIINELDDSKALLFIFKTCSSDHTAELFSYLSTDQQENLIHLFSDKQLLELVSNSYSDDLADFMNDLPANLVSRILSVADKTLREEINTLLNYKKDSAGSIMTTEYITIPQSYSVKKALDKIRSIGRDNETIYSTFVIDSQRFLKGVIQLEDLVYNGEDTEVGSFMKTDFQFCHVNDDQEIVAGIFKRYDLSVLPVLNETDRLVGIITIDDIVDVIEEEASEDILRLAKVIPIEDAYMESSFQTIAKKSIPWLILLLFLGALAGFVLNQFEETLQRVAILAAFIPMLMDTGGNAGNQSATLVIRGFATHDITLKDFLPVFLKESKVSLLVGLAVGAFSFVWISFLIMIGFLSLDSADLPWTPGWIQGITSIAAVVSLTLFFAIIIAKMAGSILPFIAVKFKKDPAVMASPFVTTIVDVSALVIYFVLASWLLNLI